MDILIYSQAEKESESGDVKVSLGPEETHVGLHLHVKMAAAMTMLRLHLLIAVFPHLPDGI